MIVMGYRSVIDDPLGPAVADDAGGGDDGGVDGGSDVGGDEGGGNKGCFIATAAYGSYLDPHVQVLRDFRDRHLISNRAGRTFVNLYYTYSPPIADYISEHKGLKVATRIGLTPVVYGFKYPYAAAVVFVVGLGFIGYSVRRTRRSKL